MLFLCLSVAGLTSAALAAGHFEKQQILIETGQGKLPFQVEIARTPGQQSRGLMFRRTLGAREGMLFLYPKPQAIAMWMKNTILPLDMIFIKPGGRVLRIEHNTEPFSERVISSQGDVVGVLEVKAGIAQEIGLKPGDKILHPFFKQ